MAHEQFDQDWLNASRIHSTAEGRPTIIQTAFFDVCVFQPMSIISAKAWHLLPPLWIGLLFAFSSGFIIAAHAGLRGPGKYCGVVVFDRWDTCFLLSGPYITYISDSVKNDLRPYKGKAMQIDASNVFQPENPGDALIRKYEIIGPAPDTHHWAMLDGLELSARSDFGPHGTSTFLLEIRNTGSSPIEVNNHEVAPVLLVPMSKSIPFQASDGVSVAVITRGDLVNLSSWRSTIDGVTRSYSYAIDSQIRSPERFQLNPGQSMRDRITFEVPPGQYQFMFGYGGGVHEEKSLASNAISFDLNDDGTATVASCSPPKRVSNSGTSPLKNRIPAPDPAKYRSILDARDWRNPYLMVRADGIDVRAISAVTGIPAMSPADVVWYLEKLPSIAWPYGLVVAVQENGVRALGDDDCIRENRDELLRFLKAAGVETELWP